MMIRRRKFQYALLFIFFTHFFSPSISFAVTENFSTVVNKQWDCGTPVTASVTASGMPQNAEIISVTVITGYFDYITHQNAGSSEITISLAHNYGTSVQIASNFIGIWATSQAFDGQNPNGTWTLYLKDNVDDQLVGYITEFSIGIEYVVPDPCAGVNCDDGDTCTDDTCSNGVCSHVDNGTCPVCPNETISGPSTVITNKINTFDISNVDDGVWSTSSIGSIVAESTSVNYSYADVKWSSAGYRSLIFAPNNGCPSYRKYLTVVDCPTSISGPDSVSAGYQAGFTSDISGNWLWNIESVSGTASAEITTNTNTADLSGIYGDGTVTISVVGLDPACQSHKAYKTITVNPSPCPTKLYVDKQTLKPGQKLWMDVDATLGPQIDDRNWSLIHKSGTAKATIDAAGGTAVLLNPTGEGWVTVQYASGACAPLTQDIEIVGLEKDDEDNKCDSGCDSGECNVPGKAKAKLSSIDFQLPLGKTNHGVAGSILLQSDVAALDNATPRGLDVVSGGQAEVVFKISDYLRQVATSQVLVDIQPEENSSDGTPYNIRFYHLDPSWARATQLCLNLQPNTPTCSANQTTGGAQGYVIPAGTTPYATYHVENPNYGVNNNVVRITKYSNCSVGAACGEGIETEYEWVPADETWILREGNGLREIAKKDDLLLFPEVAPIEIETVTESGLLTSKTMKVYHDIPISPSATSRELADEIVDPDGEALTTSYTYYEDPDCTSVNPASCGQIKSRVNPDGSWIKYEYDVEGRLSKETISWLNELPDALEGSVKVISYDYTPQDFLDSADYFSSLPRVVTETINGQVTSKKFYAYIDGTSDRTEKIEQATNPGASYGDPENLTTYKEYYKASEGLESGRVKLHIYPDGRVDTYFYDKGTYDATSTPGVFTAGLGTDLRITVNHGASGSSYFGIPNETTVEKKVVDEFGNALLNETYVYVDSGVKERIAWTAYTLPDEFGRPKRVERSDGSQVNADWNCCGVAWTEDELGIHTDFFYDDLGRPSQEKKLLSAGDYVTDHIHEARDGGLPGRKISRVATSGGLSESTSEEYDLAGRLSAATNKHGLTTNVSYSTTPEGGLRITKTHPGGATEISDYYRDGRIRSVSGTAATYRSYEYGVNADGTGTRWTKVSFDAAGNRWEKTTYDMAGRKVKVEGPVYPSGSAVLESYEYYSGVEHNEGLLKETHTIGQLLPLLYEYNPMGRLVRSGMDTGYDGVLDPASTDRIQETDVRYVKDANGVWWLVSNVAVYAEDSVDLATTVETKKIRLTGLIAAGLTGETVSIDSEGNETITQKVRLGSTETHTTQHPDASNSSVNTFEEGLLKSSLSKTGVMTTYGYDALGRLTHVTNLRTGATETHYSPNGQIDWIKDPAGNYAYYSYEVDTGRLAAESASVDFSVNVTRYSYNDRGQTEHVWGDAATPVEYTYDDYGKLEEMHTWTSGTPDYWNSDLWPEPTAVPQITRWIYHPTTGLLESKTDPSGNGATYTYYSSGKLATRTWSRSLDAKVSYSYNWDTGELWAVYYDDGTPDVTNYTYDRLGRLIHVDDVLGGRDFTYWPHSLRLNYEEITSPAFPAFSPYTLYKYEDGSVAGEVEGRPKGFIDVGYNNVTWGYEPATGRPKTISWNNNTPVTYVYVPNSDLIYKVLQSGGRDTTYGYDPNRNLTTMVENKFNGALVSRYDYQYNALRQRENATYGGRAFAEMMNIKLKTSNGGAQGGNPGGGVEVMPKHRVYHYDALGNRKDSTDWNKQSQALRNIDYLPEPLNENQYDLINQYDDAQPRNLIGSTDLSYDLDGNLSTAVSGGNAVKYDYDAENRLKSVQPQTPAEGDVKVEFLYDYMGRRVIKHAFNYTAGSWTSTKEVAYAYNGWNLIREQELSPGAQSKTYVWGLDLSGTSQGAGGVGGLLAATENGNEYFYLYDANGNVGQIVNSADGAISAHYEYDPFGNIVWSMGDWATSNPFRFSTKYHDDETGLVYYGFRYYSPELGRWINRDPLGELGGMNLYAFVGNNPVIYSDPLGLFEWNLETRASGLLRAGFSLVEMDVGLVFGTATLPTGVGAAAGALMVAHGADNFWSGLRTFAYGHHVRSNTAEMLMSLGLSEEDAETINAIGMIAVIGGVGDLNQRVEVNRNFKEWCILEGKNAYVSPISLEDPKSLYGKTHDEVEAILGEEGFYPVEYTETSEAYMYQKDSIQGRWQVTVNYGNGIHSGGKVYTTPYYYKVTGPNYPKTKIIDPARYPASEWGEQTRWRIIDGNTGDVLKNAGEKYGKN